MFIFINDFCNILNIHTDFKYTDIYKYTLD